MRIPTINTMVVIWCTTIWGTHTGTHSGQVPHPLGPLGTSYHGVDPPPEVSPWVPIADTIMVVTPSLTPHAVIIT